MKICKFLYLKNGKLIFKLWYSEDLYNTVFNHKSLLVNLEWSTQE